ncbi:uncharacterized protein [Dysidea avara]|uniref:uncharacterized protein n=1 Tax=Dysidea avara TaxID=196820 RepID=UPI00331A167A
MVSLEDMSMEELGEWVMEKFGWEAKDAFLDQGMDGEAVSLAFASTAGPDCLKDVVPKYGLCLKVYRAIKEQLEHDQKGPEESQDDSTIILSESDVNDTDNNNPVPVGKATPTSSRTTTKPTRKRSDYIASSSSLSSTERKSTPNKVPDPFPIPRFRKATEESFNQKRVADDDRKYVVRTLATVLCTYVQNPSMKDCEVVAKSLVATYPFLKQHHSWKQFLYTKCQNINWSSPKDKSADRPRKKPKLDLYKHPYPAIRFAMDDDEESHTRHLNLIKAELAKSTPDMDRAKELMCRTFSRRRTWLLEEQPPIQEVLAKYPLLKRLTIVSSELDYVIAEENCREKFIDNWLLYQPAIIAYSNAHKNKPAALKDALRDIDGDAEAVSLTALRCTGYLLTTKTRKKEEKGKPSQENEAADDIPFLMKEIMRGE